MRKRQPRDLAGLTHVATIGPPPPADWGWFWRLSRILLVTGGLLAVFFLSRHWVPQLLAEHWRQSLRTAGDERAEMLVASAARLGRPGLPVLLDALGSPRERVSRAGAEWLHRQLRSWENVPNRQGQRNVEALAKALADEVDSFHPAARLDAARVARRILGWRLDPQIVDRGQVTRSCDKVLRAASLSLPAETALAAGSAGVRAEEGWPPRRDSQEPLPREDETRLRFPQLPQPSPANPRIAARADPATPVDSGLLSDDPADRARVWTMRGTSLDQDRSAPLESDTAGGAVGLDTEAATLDSASAGQIASLSTDECFRRLHSANSGEAIQAEAELRRRGVNARELSIARRVLHPDPLVRLQLVRQLPETLGINTVGWLLKMTDDESAEVRLSAITLLATCTDPRILAEVEAVARNDSDERIRRQAEMLARRRDDRRR